MKAIGFAGIVVCLLIAGACPALATYGGLIVIPTADAVGAHYYSLEWQGDGSLPGHASDSRLLNTQFGFGDKLEAGVDVDYSRDENGKEEATPIYNVKYIFETDTKSDYKLAAGIYGIERHATAVPYLAGTKCLVSGYRLHLGALHNDVNYRWFAGVDKAVGDRLTLMADYTYGDENYSSAGFNYQITSNYGVMMGAQFPNAGGETIYTVHFVVGGDFRTCPAAE